MSDSEKRLGDPMDLPKKSVETAVAKPIVEAAVRREGDTGLGVPEFEPTAARPLTEAEKRSHQLKEEQQFRKKAESVLFKLESEDGWKLPTPLRNFISTIFVGAAAVLGIFLVTQTVQFMTTLRTLPEWGQWLAGCSLALFSVLLLIILIKLLWEAIRFQQTPRIHLKSMKLLAERRSMQAMAIEKQGKARKLLVKYLRTYPKSTSDRKRMLNLGMTAEEWSRLMEAKGRLLDSSRPLTHSDWLDDFRSEFQGLLDEVSRRRIKQYAVRVGAGTAASPIAMVDQMIVLYGCSGVVKDLLTIYQLRPAFGQTAVILSRGVVQTYLSGMVEDAMEPLADMGADSLSEFAGEGASILTGTVGRAVGAKAAEAALNGWLLHRLGRRVMTQLQPIKA